MNRPSAIIEAARILETSVHPRNHLAFLSQDPSSLPGAGATSFHTETCPQRAL